MTSGRALYYPYQCEFYGLINNTAVFGGEKERDAASISAAPAIALQRLQVFRQVAMSPAGGQCPQEY